MIYLELLQKAKRNTDEDVEQQDTVVPALVEHPVFHAESGKGTEASTKTYCPKHFPVYRQGTPFDHPKAYECQNRTGQKIRDQGSQGKNSIIPGIRKETGNRKTGDAPQTSS